MKNQRSETTKRRRRDMGAITMPQLDLGESEFASCKSRRRTQRRRTSALPNCATQPLRSPARREPSNKWIFIKENPQRRANRTHLCATRYPLHGLPLRSLYGSGSQRLGLVAVPICELDVRPADPGG
jgi:hypothetical protein